MLGWSKTRGTEETTEAFPGLLRQVFIYTKHELIPIFDPWSVRCSQDSDVTAYLLENIRVSHIPHAGASNRAFIPG